MAEAEELRFEIERDEAIPRIVRVRRKGSGARGWVSYVRWDTRHELELALGYLDQEKPDA